MTPRRRRVLLFHERALILQETRTLAGRAVELIAASDFATIEAALRLYQQIDVVMSEKSSARVTPITILRLAEQLHPQAKRVMLVEHEAMAGVYDAVHDRTINHLVFLPVRIEQLREAMGIPEAAPAPEPMPKYEPVSRITRLERQPPLTGGIKASSSPSLSR